MLPRCLEPTIDMSSEQDISQVAASKKEDISWIFRRKCLSQGHSRCVADRIEEVRGVDSL